MAWASRVVASKGINPTVGNGSKEPLPRVGTVIPQESVARVAVTAAVRLSGIDVQQLSVDCE